MFPKYIKLVSSTAIFTISIFSVGGCAHNEELAYNKRENQKICSYTPEQVFTCQSLSFWKAQSTDPHFEYGQQLLPIHQRVEVIEDELNELENKK